MSTATALKEELVTLEEYLKAEVRSLVKHEYLAGRVFAMAGGTPRHAEISFNIAVAIGKRLQGKRCRGASGDQRIRVEGRDSELYPDVVVVCPPAIYSPRDPLALVNPALIVEVLSPSSREFDRGEKFELYARIPELRDYLLVWQDRVLVEHFARGQDGESWILRRWNERENILVLDDLEIEVPLAEIYEGIEAPSGLVVLNEPPRAE